MDESVRAGGFDASALGLTAGSLVCEAYESGGAGIGVLTTFRFLGAFVLGHLE
jgi:hypothetical protein